MGLTILVLFIKKHNRDRSLPPIRSNPITTQAKASKRDPEASEVPMMRSFPLTPPHENAFQVSGTASWLKPIGPRLGLLSRMCTIIIAIAISTINGVLWLAGFRMPTINLHVINADLSVPRQSIQALEISIIQSNFQVVYSSRAIFKSLL
ncbi:hypothetical protein L7F22_009553 [Adiantum nelumboides]|nr:hypothetical protein [Adiantum nelumboides]